MTKLKDISTGIDFDAEPTHIVDFDPNADVQQREGQNGKYNVIPVKENGESVDLPVSSKRLIRQLQAITEPCTIRITRSGKGFATDYEVEVV